MKEIEQKFEDFLMRHNIHKAKELMRGIKDMKVLYKVPQKELGELLSSQELNPLWLMINEIPFTVVKSKLCDAHDLAQIVVNSCAFNTELDEREWLYLRFHLYRNKKKFLTNISHSDRSYLKSDAKYGARAQKLPWDFLALKTCALVTPLDLDTIRAVSEDLSLCTLQNKDKIGPDHHKMLVFVKNRLTAVLTVYPHHNCYAVSGRNNCRVDSEIEQEIEAQLLSVGLLSNKPHLIYNQDDFFTVNHFNKKDFSADRIESELKSNESLIRAMFPDAEQIVLKMNEEKQKKLEEQKLKAQQELKDNKEKLMAMLADKELFVKIQENLSKQASEARDVYELLRITALINRLTGNEVECRRGSLFASLFGYN